MWQILRIALQKIILGWLLGILVMTLSGCGGKESKPANILTVQAKSETTIQYFSGPIQPLTTYPIISPVDGIIQKRYFSPGTAVAKDQLLFVISSAKLSEIYNNAVIEYIKALRDYNISQVELNGAIILKKYGIVSELEYLATTAKSQNADFAQQQALAKLTTILQDLNIPLSFLEKLKTNDPNSIKAVLSLTNPTIKIFSPATGVAILSGSSNNSAPPGLENINPEGEGSLVKANETLLTIGNMSGIIIPIEVSEVHIGKIKVGAPILVTGDAFPNTTLKGTVYIKQRQPIAKFGGGATTYQVLIVIPHLTDAQSKSIRIGMNAEVKIPVIESSAISIPLTAVYQKDGRSVVKVINPVSKAAEEVPVTTGATQLNTIDITNGLKVGDKILVNAQSH